MKKASLSLSLSLSNWSLSSTSRTDSVRENGHLAEYVSPREISRLLKYKQAAKYYHKEGREVTPQRPRVIFTICTVMIRKIQHNFFY